MTAGEILPGSSSHYQSSDNFETGNQMKAKEKERGINKDSGNTFTIYISKWTTSLRKSH